MSFEDQTLDGMPEPPPAWDRPDHGVRMSALALDYMLMAALPHCSTDEDMPVLCGIQLTVVADTLSTSATDRYSVIRECREVVQTCDDWEFLLRAEDARSLRVLLRSVLRGLKDEAKFEEPVDLALEHTLEGPSLRVLGQGLDVRFTPEQGEFPGVHRMLDGILSRLATDPVGPCNVTLNPILLARAVQLQSAGRRSSAFQFRSSVNAEGGCGPVVITTWDPEDDVHIAVMPIKAGDPP